MLQIPSEFQTGFEALLKKKKIEEPYRPHYKKWLRYYLAFRSKYGRLPPACNTDSPLT